ncbi:MAG: glycosyltransferase, partial [Polyangiales bacterium]
SVKALQLTMRGRVTHITLDGLSTDLGRSQVLAVSERLQSMGWQCTILSLEPASAVFDRLQTRMAASGVRWYHQPYQLGRIGAARNAVSMSGMIKQIWGRTDLFHCRSYFGAFFPAVAGIFRSAPYVFDTRGYWIDEKIEAGRWFQDPASRAIARRIERELYDRASATVSLTELAAEDVRRGRFGRQHSADRSICIPTCVDYDKFKIERGAPPDEFLRDGLIVAYVGSLNASYEYRKSLRLAALILERNPQAKFLALTSQVRQMNALVGELSIPSHRYLVRSVIHDEIHEWLPWIDVGLMLLVRSIRAKRASMPTKLGEFFATGVTSITHGANSEIADWVRRTGSGLALEDLSTASLERAADFAVSGRPDMETRIRARRIAEEHFSLASASRRYDALFQKVLC